MKHQASNTRTTLQRFAFRLVVIIVFAMLWPSLSVTPAIATAALCLTMGVACLLSAMIFREPLRGSGFNRWHEGAALVGLALFVYLKF